MVAWWKEGGGEDKWWPNESKEKIGGFVFWWD